MGRKNKIKKNKGRADAQSPRGDNTPSLLEGLAFLNPEQRSEITGCPRKEPLLLPPKPNMALDPLAMQQKLLATPTEERTATSSRLVRAHEMISEIEQLQESREPWDDNFVDIGELKSDPSYIHECTLWIRAFVCSDFRVMCPAGLPYGSTRSPLPECWTHITSLHPLDDNEPQLMNLGALSFVVMLATAIRISSPKERFSLQIVHELHAHADGNYDWLNFEELKLYGSTKELDESFLRFALASTGVKRARALYRDTGHRTLTPFQSKDDVATQSKTLLKSIEIFAKEQCRYRPGSPVGHWNLGWVSSQVKHNGLHPWTAAAKCYNHMADCCLLAEKADDDFYRAIAGVDAAMSLVIGGKPLVGYKLPSGAAVQALRDLTVTPGASGGKYHGTKIGAPSLRVAEEAGAKEERRVREGVPPTLLEPGEELVIPHWEVRRIWNYAMEAYSRVERFGHGQYVFGESSGWIIAEDFLKRARSLPPEKYAACPRAGFERTKDKGAWPCDCCGAIKSNLKQCSVCKKAQYCSRECQKKAWKKHKAVCVPAK